MDQEHIQELTSAALQQRLRMLLDTDPRTAVIEAKKLIESKPTSSSSISMAAAILIDAGVVLSDTGDVDLGVRLLRRLVSHFQNESTLAYNLANGLIALAQLEKTKGPDWYLKTNALRREARWWFRKAADNSEGEVKTQALTNLANALDVAYRWAEAYDCYLEALRADPNNGVAAGCAAQVLYRLLGTGLSHSERLHRVAAQYARIAQDNAPTVERYAGRSAVEIFSRLPTVDSGTQTDPPKEITDEYLSFVSAHHLALTPTVEGLDANLKRWDSVQIEQIIEPIDAGSESPPVFAMINTLKADFVLARHMAFEGMQVPTWDTSIYADSLDYAVYGIAPAKLSLAQRAALDILDRVAVLVNEYLDVGLKPKRIHFRTFWRQENHGWRQRLHEELASGNTAIAALGEVAEDLEAQGYLAPKRSLRNTSTHRFVVLHDPYSDRYRASESVEHHEYSSFAGETIETLKVVRSAILYLAELISVRERRKSGESKGVNVPLVVPTHHEIWGME
jgi:tetratricopeptide (TPR) repeat protein